MRVAGVFLNNAREEDDRIAEAAGLRLVRESAGWLREQGLV